MNAQENQGSRLTFFDKICNKVRPKNGAGKTNVSLPGTNSKLRLVVEDAMGGLLDPLFMDHLETFPADGRDDGGIGPNDSSTDFTAPEQSNSAPNDFIILRKKPE